MNEWDLKEGFIKSMVFKIGIYKANGIKKSYK